MSLTNQPQESTRREGCTTKRVDGSIQRNALRAVALGETLPLCPEGELMKNILPALAILALPLAA